MVAGCYLRASGLRAACSIYFSCHLKPVPPPSLAFASLISDSRTLQDEGRARTSHEEDPCLLLPENDSFALPLFPIRL